MVQIEDNGYEDLKAQVVKYIDDAYENKNFTFKVVARRANKQYPVVSDQINRDLGEVILNAFPETKVNVHTPDVLLRVEVRHKINIFSETIPGPAECRSEQRDVPCYYYPAESTAQLQAG